MLQILTKAVDVAEDLVGWQSPGLDELAYSLVTLGMSADKSDDYGLLAGEVLPFQFTACLHCSLLSRRIPVTQSCRVLGSSPEVY